MPTENPSQPTRLAEVNGVPIVQVGPMPAPIHAPSSATSATQAPAPAPVAVPSRVPTPNTRETGEVLATLIPLDTQAPAWQAAVQPPAAQMQAGTRDPSSNRASWILKALGIAAAAITVQLFFVSCGYVFSSDTPEYTHEDLGGSNGMAETGSVSQPYLPPSSNLPQDLVGGDDDGELHPSWDDTVGYAVRDESVELSESEEDGAYGMPASYEFSITYPQLEGDLEHLDEINALIRERALGHYVELYEQPSNDMVALVSTVAENGPARISDEAAYAITYNSDRLISISWSHDLCYGSTLAEYIRLETLNIDLATGQVYELSDVLELTEPMAVAWTDNYLRYSQGMDSAEMFGRDEIAQGVLGEGTYGDRTSAELFVDAEGRPNLGVTFWLGNDRGIVRGWWDVTLDEELLDGTRKDSPFWELLPDAEEESTE